MNDWKRTFAIIWSGQFLSILTSSIVNYAIIIWISITTKSAESLALAAVCAMMPQAIAGLFTGILIDRWRRKLVMIVSDSFIAACTLVLAILFYLDVADIWHIYVLLALRSVGSAFHSPAMQASVPLLAPSSELIRVAGISQMINSVCNIAGPALGALFLTWMNMTSILLLDVVGAILACATLLFIRIPDLERTDTGQSPHLWREAKEAVAEVRSHRGLPCLMAMAVLATFCIMPISVLFPLMTLEHFSGSMFQMSLVEMLWGGGSLLGSAILGLKLIRFNEVALINRMYVLLGLTFILSGLLPSSGYVGFLCLTAMGGISGSFYFATFTTILQTRIRPAVMGRVFSFYMSVTLFPSLVGLLATGFIADVIGISHTFVIGGLAIMLVGVFSFFISPINDLRKSFKKR